MNTQIKRVAVSHQLAGHEAMRLVTSLAQTPLTGTTHVVLNISRVSQIDASGVAVLVRLYSQLRRHGVSLHVHNASQDVAAELNRVALSAVVPVSVRAQAAATAPMQPSHA